MKIQKKFIYIAFCVNLLKQQLKQQKDLITLNNNLNDFIEHAKYIKTWTDFFFSLKNIITKFDKKVIIFLDEINWFKSFAKKITSIHLLQSFKAWNSQLVFCQNLTLFFAGSTKSFLDG